VHAWANDEKSLRKAGSQTDPYHLFRAMLESGDPPASMQRKAPMSCDIAWRSAGLLLGPGALVVALLPPVVRIAAGVGSPRTSGSAASFRRRTE
jgi:hypothetical protein